MVAVLPSNRNLHHGHFPRVIELEYTTRHLFAFKDAVEALREWEAESVHLVVTSPPYPMVEMWDECFSLQCAGYKRSLEKEDGRSMHTWAHHRLANVWRELARVVAPGCFVCINIGNAVRNVGGEFRLYDNVGPTINTLAENGFVPLPSVIWSKPSNSPTKFLGSGMLPAGAYITQEHEHILIFRKGAKREFDDTNKVRRRASALFWEERNVMFSDLWTDRGVSQVGQTRRTGAFPLSIPDKLIQMFSLYGDVVMDPFGGTGTTMLAALCNGRNSVSFDNDPSVFEGPYENVIYQSGQLRWEDHQQFIQDLRDLLGEDYDEKKQFKHFNTGLDVPVKSPQERELIVIDSRLSYGPEWAEDRSTVMYEGSHQPYHPPEEP